MKIGLIGYGKMGKEIEKIAIERGHDIPLIIDVENMSALTPANLRECDVAIEFTIPGSAVRNYLTCFEAGIPVVSGTTGWLHQREFVYENCKKNDGTFFYASNFSIGVNLFFELNKKLASLMAHHTQYKVRLKEIHHTQKLDAPSGTAISLADDLLRSLNGLTEWTYGRTTILQPASHYGRKNRGGTGNPHYHL
jgi:4-hydroxy-tetrahydrodipicolinate reductase